MRTRSLLVFTALAATLPVQIALAQTAPQIERIGGYTVEILTASASDTPQGLRVSGLVRRARPFSRPPAAAHLDVTAFDAGGHQVMKTPVRIGVLTATRIHREPTRYTAVLPLLTRGRVAKLEVRYQAGPHVGESSEAETGETSR